MKQDLTEAVCATSYCDGVDPVARERRPMAASQSSRITSRTNRRSSSVRQGWVNFARGGFVLSPEFVGPNWVADFANLPSSPLRAIDTARPSPSLTHLERGGSAEHD